jgi:hypothetical protein
MKLILCACYVQHGERWTSQRHTMLSQKSTPLLCQSNHTSKSKGIVYVLQPVSPSFVHGRSKTQRRSFGTSKETRCHRELTGLLPILICTTTTGFELSASTTHGHAGQGLARRHNSCPSAWTGRQTPTKRQMKRTVNTKIKMDTVSEGYITCNCKASRAGVRCTDTHL